jgi:cellobiose phosphorylase
VAESVFIAGLFCLSLDEIIALAKQIGREAEIGHYQDLRRQMEEAVEKAGWDGEWFRRAFDDFGNPVGSKECKEGQIFIEPQGMCVMARLGIDDGKAEKALDSVAKRLAFEHGIALLHPAYQRYYLHLGEISSYPPGYKENASVFSHTNPWIMIAETKIGRGDKALAYYLRINPSVREAISEIHRCEPYVYAQMISGPEAVVKGEAKNSWLTGTAAWTYVAMTQYILGVRPTFDGLQVAPVIPSTWKGFEMTRKFRGVTFKIKVERQGSGNESSILVDGKTIQGNIIPVPGSGAKVVEVFVTLH